MLNARKGSTPLSYQIQPGAQYLYDYVTRRAVRYVETVVPTIRDGAKTDQTIPADRYYAHFGMMLSAGDCPFWLGTSSIGSNTTFNQWDATAKHFYMRFAAATAAAFGINATPKVIYPSGPFGQSTSFAPKNAEVSAVRLQFRARFNTNADYGTKGYGASSGNSSTVVFSDTANHFIQVTRNSGNWELGTGDGTTISQSASSGGADSSFHNFLVIWDGTDVKLYVDGSLVITKTTNLPTQPLAACGDINSATNTADIVDYLVDWELAA